MFPMFCQHFIEFFDIGRRHDHHSFPMHMAYWIHYAETSGFTDWTLKPKNPTLSVCYVLSAFCWVIYIWRRHDHHSFPLHTADRSAVQWLHWRTLKPKNPTFSVRWFVCWFFDITCIGIWKSFNVLFSAMLYTELAVHVSALKVCMYVLFSVGLFLAAFIFNPLCVLCFYFWSF